MQLVGTRCLRWIVVWRALVACGLGSPESVDRPAAQESGAATASGGVSGASAAGAASTDNPPVVAGTVAPPVAWPDGACVSTGVIEASVRPTNLLFLIDRSGSMGCNLPPITSSAACEAKPTREDAAAPSKWEIVRDALKAAIESLPPSARGGITYFSNDSLCGVQSTPDVALSPLEDAQRARLARSLDGVTPSGGTPLVGALILAFKHLNPDQTPGVPHGKRFVVLLTDGQESCAPDEAARLLELEMPKAETAAITTFVIGVPGSEVSRGFLSELAFAGRTPSSPSCSHGGGDPLTGDCHFDMSEHASLADGLAGALATITGRTLSCEISVPQPSGGGQLDYDKVNVAYVPAQGEREAIIGQDASRPCDGGANGWQYSDDRSTIRICGAACDRVRRAASISIALGCESYRVE